MLLTQKDIDRFWRLVDKETTPDGCWNYKGHLVNGYGQFWLNKKNEYAQRVSYTLERGPIQEGMYVCHTCDNKRCCNPDHLFFGTPQDNMTDKVNKGRQHHPSSFGEENGNHKLTEAQVREIRALPKMSQKEIAAMYGVHNSTISLILKRKLWKNEYTSS